MKKFLLLATAMLAAALFNPRSASAQVDAGTPSDGAVSPTATPQALASGTGCVAPAGEPSCQQWVVLTRCLASEAAAQAATCTDLSGRAQEAARRAIVACRGQSAELAALRTQLATVIGERDACLQRESNPSRREVPAGSRSVRLPNCLGSSGLYCRAGGRVLMGEACRASRGSLQTAWCACAPGYRVVATPRTFGSTGERLTAGWLCAAVLPGGGVLMPSNTEIERMVRDHETRLTTLESQIRDLCTVQVVPDGGSEPESRVSCAALRVLIDRAREAAGTGDAPDLTEIRSQIVALEAIVADHRRQIGGLQSVVGVSLCNLPAGQVATVENCRPATGGGGSRRPVIHAVRLGVEGSLRFSGHLTPFGTVGYGVVLPVGGSDNLLLGIDGILGSYGATGTGAIWGFALRFGWEHAVSPSVSLGLGSRFVLFQDFGNQNRAEEAIGNYRGFSVTVGPTATFGLGAGFTFQVSAGIGYHRSVVFHPDPVRGASEPGSWGVNLNGALERRF